METKTFTSTLEVKDDEPGRVTAVIATFNVIDRDGDVILPGAFVDGQEVPLVAAHDWSMDGWIGKGVIRVTDTEAIFDGQFWLDTTDGAEAYKKVKNMGDLQQWSWGFHVPEGAARTGVFQGQTVRFLGEDVPLEVNEASPVLVGAGVGTRTLSVKGMKRALAVHRTPVSEEAWDGPATVATIPNDAGAAVLQKMFAWMDPDANPDTKAAYKFIHHEWRGGPGPANMTACSAGIGVLNGARGGADIPDADRVGVWRHLAAHLRDGDREPPELRALVADGMKFVDHAGRVLADTRELLDRARSLADLRAKEGRVLSSANVERLTRVLESLRELAGVLEELVSAAAPATEKGMQLFLDYQRTLAQLRGCPIGLASSDRRR